MNTIRCKWAQNQPQIYQDYHDFQWGVPVYDDHTLFEMLILESFHTGLSWLIVLKKRDNFRLAFDNFELDKIANYDDNKVQELLQNPGIIRNRGKITSAISNAKAFQVIQSEYGSFSNYLWFWTDNQVILNKDDQFRNRTRLSDSISADLKKRGMKFLGSITIYAYLQAVGVINDHETNCSCYPK